MEQITKLMVERLVDSTSVTTGIEHTLEGGNGGWKVCRNKGATNVFEWMGYSSKREVYYTLHAYLTGYRLARVYKLRYVE